jgi:hypothetical protein
MRARWTLTGVTPLLMHADDVEAADELTAWRKDPKNKSLSVAGDDRSPAWTWQTYLYSDGDKGGASLAMPADNIMRCLCYAATKIPLSKGKGTFKQMSQSGILIDQDFCRFTVDGESIPLATIRKLKSLSFAEQKKAVQDLGFDLSVKRARVGSSKHVRVRAKFSPWQVDGELEVFEPAITFGVLTQMFEMAGRLSGLGDWRPSAPEKPGNHGMFTAQVTQN